VDNFQEAEEQQLHLAGIVPYPDIGFRRAESMESADVDGASKQACIGIPNRGLFSRVQDLYTCLGEEILSTWLNNVMYDIGETILTTYLSKKWHSLPDQSSDFPDLNISKEFLLPIQKLSSLCKTVEQGMTTDIAQNWLKRLAVSLDKVSLESRF
jgi:hypothetical protein